MASAAPFPAEQAQLRPSFAKVAASALKPQILKESTSKARPPVATPRIPVQPHKARSVPVNGEAPKVVAEKNEAKNASKPAGDTALQRVQPTQTAPLAVPASEAKTEDIDRPQSIAVVKVSITEDNSTQLSSSDGSGKPPSIDGKSVASATTFALDEKESLRPDDSASLRAVEEEDTISPPDSVIADSRQGSDNGAARAFRDQLHEIAVMNPHPHRGVPVGRFPNLPNGPHALYDPNPSLNGARPISQPPANVIPLINCGPNMPAIPDEKLLEALQSPRDRLFVVKMEQDFIDFVNNKDENEYSLPNCNAFYRMLAHRLADYYSLGHVVDTTMTGVKITRTDFCRIPPPLSQMVDFAKGTNTPPAELPARKIMRRDDGKSGTNTTANSQNPSKTTSEIGGSDGSNDGSEGNKDKAALTREEREARYREARQRIFGNAESVENDAAEGTGSGEEKEKEKDPSRSSSTSGKKKNKKQRNYDDDDFQARSRFNAYYPQQYPVPGYTGDNVVYYNGFPGPVQNPQYTSMNAGASPPPTYSNPYPAMMSPDTQSQYAWAGQQYQPSTGPMMYPGYGPMQNGYDLSADFQRGMSSFQNPGLPSQATPKMANPQMVPYQEPYQQPQHMPMNSGWSQVPQQPSYPMAQSPYAQNGPSNRPMSAPHQAPMPSPYQYGQYPSNPYNGNLNRNQHPLPGSYNRQQFNPQTQAFIPGSRIMPFGMQPHMGQAPQMNGYGGYQMPGQSPIPPQIPRISPSVASTPSFGSPQSMHGNNSTATLNRIASQSGDPASSQSSIAKYGTPSHLPPKPPAPAPVQQSAPKFALPSTTRVPSNMSSGLVNNAPPMPIRGGAGSASFTNTSPN